MKMLKEIIQRKESKVVIVVIFIAFLLIVASLVMNPKQEKNNLNSEITESEEFAAISGVWKVTEYLGEGVEYHGGEPATEAEKSENDKTIKETKETYLNKELYMDIKNITDFGPPSELGYQVLTFEDLFFIYRQPANLPEMSPPFLCISFELKGYDDYLDIIIDANGIATLIVKGSFFRLEKIDTD